MMGDLCRPLAIALVALVASEAAPARAADEPASAPAADRDLQAAKESFEAAQAAFLREQYEDAAAKFLAAFDHKPFPAFLFNAAVSLEKGKQLAKAKELFERYLQTDRNASDTAQVRARIDDLAKLLTPEPPSSSPSPSSSPPSPPPPPALPSFDTKGLVVIDSKPQGATIYLNDKKDGAFGKTPWHGSLESKPVRLILEAKGFKPEQRSITPRSDKMVDVYIALSEEHYLGWIEVISNVPGAQVFIDRTDVGAVGRTPFSGHLKPGDHTITLEQFGYVQAVKTITVRPGTAVVHTVPMVKSPNGWVTVTGQLVDGGSVVVDGKAACAAPCRAEVAPGKHDIVLEKQGMETYERELEVHATTESTVDVRMSARPPRTRALGTAVLAVLLAGTGAFVGHLSDNTKSSISADIAAGRPVDNRDPRFVRGKLEAIGADALYGLAAVVGVSAAWSFVFAHGPDSTGTVSDKAIGLGPTLGPSSGGLAAWGRF